jgi:nitrite reductase/ring-hydroxylating ferredoxin subunit
LADLSALDDLRRHSGSPFRRAFDGKWIALFCDGERIFAIDDVCLRCRASLAEGALAGTVVTCSCGWRYDLEYGQVLGFPRLRIGTYAVRLIGGRVLVGSRSPSR